jgi:hypothetical protein
VTVKELARLLIEEVVDANIDRKVAVYVNRLMLRLHSQPALLANLDNVAVFKPGIQADTEDQVEDGEFQEDDDTNDAPGKDEDAKQDEMDSEDSTVILQLSFRRLPREVLAPLTRLLAAPRDPKMTRYTKDGFARLGVEIGLKPSDFPGDDYEYSF